MGVFLEVTTLAYDNDACRGAGVLAVTAAVVDAWPLAVGGREAAVVIGAVWFVVEAGVLEGAVLVIRLSSVWFVFGCVVGGGIGRRGGGGRGVCVCVVVLWWSESRKLCDEC